MENSPIVLAFAQIIILIANAILYARQKSQTDRGKPEVSRLEALVQTAMVQSSDAKHGVEMMEVSHYKALLAKYEGIIIELRDAQAQIRALSETVDSLSNKLASRERADRKMVRSAKEEPPEEREPAPGQISLDEALRQHGIPLNGGPHVAPVPARPSTFGRVAR